MSEVICPSCKEKFNHATEEIRSCSDPEYDLEFGISHPIEELEQLRLTLQSFLRTEVLDQLLMMYKELSTTTQEPKMYSWFVRHSTEGSSCRYAVAALKRFKEDRLDKLESQLEACLEACKKLR